LGFNIKRRLIERRERRTAEFRAHIGALLENEQVKKLGDFIQHRCGTRLQHCMDVAYYSFLVTRLFGWDSKSTARAGLLHDLFHYDRHVKGMKVKRHWRKHPQIALQNAREVCELNKIEEDIIKRHMWLITLRPPRYREGYVVTFVDKYCALREFARGIFKKAA
jgi:uncharacterized protein